MSGFRLVKEAVEPCETYVIELARTGGIPSGLPSCVARKLLSRKSEHKRFYWVDLDDSVPRIRLRIVNTVGVIVPKRADNRDYNKILAMYGVRPAIYSTPACPTVQGRGVDALLSKLERACREQFKAVYIFNNVFYGNIGRRVAFGLLERKLPHLFVIRNGIFLLTRVNGAAVRLFRTGSIGVSGGLSRRTAELIAGYVTRVAEEAGALY